MDLLSEVFPMDNADESKIGVDIGERIIYESTL